MTARRSARVATGEPAAASRIVATAAVVTTVVMLAGALVFAVAINRSGVPLTSAGPCHPASNNCPQETSSDTRLASDTVVATSPRRSRSGQWQAPTRLAVEGRQWGGKSIDDLNDPRLVPEQAAIEGLQRSIAATVGPGRAGSKQVGERSETTF